MEKTMEKVVEEEKAGIKEIKEMLDFVMCLMEAVVGSLDDGKVGIGDIWKFFGVLKKAGPAIKGMPELAQELRDLSEEEKEHLSNYISKEFNIKNDVMEGYIEQALQGAISLLDLIPLFKKK